MKTLKQTILCILTLFLLTSCRPNYERIFKENNDSFELHRPTLNKIIVDIETRYLSDWGGQKIVIQIDSMNEQTKDVL
jgi:hypothetical protein